MEIAEAVAAVERAMAAEEAELARMLSEVSTSFSPDSSRKRSATWAALESVPAHPQEQPTWRIVARRRGHCLSLLNPEITLRSRLSRGNRPPRPGRTPAPCARRRTAAFFFIFFSSVLSHPQVDRADAAEAAEAAEAAWTAAELARAGEAAGAVEAPAVRGPGHMPGKLVNHLSIALCTRMTHVPSPQPARRLMRRVSARYGSRSLRSYSS